jgi:hypothetical protein
MAEERDREGDLFRDAANRQRAAHVVILVALRVDAGGLNREGDG